MQPYVVTNARFQKLANSVQGKELWKVLNEHDNLIRLETAANLGHPAVEGVDIALNATPLSASLSGPSKDAHALRQLAGMMTRDLLQKKGYRLGPNKRTRYASIFKSGATYFKGASLQKHSCGQLLILHHHPLGNGQVMIYMTPHEEPGQKLCVVDKCPKCGEQYDRRSLSDVESTDEEKMEREDIAFD